MGNYRSEGRGGFGDRGRTGGSRFGGRSEGFGSRGGFGGRRPLEMHDATCDKCRKQCQVPFRPSGDKPVLCSDCFRQSQGSGDRDRFNSRREFRPAQSGISSEQFNQINTKLDKILKTLQELEISTEGEDEDLEILDDDEDDEDEADSEDDSKDDLGDDSEKKLEDDSDEDEDLDDESEDKQKTI